MRIEQGELGLFQQDGGAYAQQHRFAARYGGRILDGRYLCAKNSDEDDDTRHPNRTGQL
jgi:hypothetical protein